MRDALERERVRVCVPSLSKEGSPATVYDGAIGIQYFNIHRENRNAGLTSILSENADTLKPSNMRSSPPTNPESRFSTASLNRMPQPPFEKATTSPILEKVSIDIWVLW